MSQHSFPLNIAPKKRMLLLLMLAALLLAGCAQSGQMSEQPRYDPLEPSEFLPNGQSAQPLPEGVVPFSQHRGSSPFLEADGQRQSPNDSALTGLDEEGNPVSGFPTAVDQALVDQGQERFNVFCVPCHGATGEGNGVAVQFGVQQPPSLLTGNAVSMTSGDIFRIITHGQGLMYPYGYRVTPSERWAVIAYIRAMQLKSGAIDPAGLTPEDLQAIEGQP